MTRRQGLWSSVRWAAFAVVAMLLAEVAARRMLPAPLPWLQPQLRYRPDPDLIFGLEPGQIAYSADKPVPINGEGLRGPVASDPDGETMRILLLGDSVAFGLGVADGKVVSDRLAVHLGSAGIEADVLNAAVPCYNLVQSVTFLERECLEYGPDWVIVLISWDDFSDKSGVRVSEDGRLISAGEERPRGDGWITSEPVYVVRNVLKRSRFLYAVRRLFAAEEDIERRRRDILAGRSDEALERSWRHFDEAAAELARLAAECRFRLALVALPFRSALEGSHPDSSYPARVREIAHAHRLSLIDLAPAFRAVAGEPATFFLPYDEDHLNAGGHELVAHALANLLIDEEKNADEMRERRPSMQVVANEAASVAP